MLGLVVTFLATGLLFLVIHEVVYFGRSLPWYILDRTKILKNYKIQDKEIPDSEQLQCLKDVLISHFVIEAIPIFGFQPICNIVGIDYSANFPALKYFLIQITAFFFMEDTWHYWFHRLLHYGPFTSTSISSTTSMPHHLVLLQSTPTLLKLLSLVLVLSVHPFFGHISLATFI